MIGTEWDLTTALEVEREEGIEIGREEGIKNLYEYGMTAEQIANALKLPLERVKLYLNKSESD